MKKYKRNNQIIDTFEFDCNVFYLLNSLKQFDYMKFDEVIERRLNNFIFDLEQRIYPKLPEGFDITDEKFTITRYAKLYKPLEEK